MERIVLEVDSSLAKAWRRVPIALRQQLEKDIEARLSEQIRIAEQNDFKEALDNLRNQAAKNGLTQAILEDLLNEED